MSVHKICLIIIIFMGIFFPINIMAEENVDEVQLESLYDYMINIKEDNEFLKNIDIKSYIENYVKTGKSNLTFMDFVKIINKGVFNEVLLSLRLMVTLIVIGVMTALISNLENAFSNEEISNIAHFACYLIIVIALSKSFYNGVDLVKETIDKISNFMYVLVPSFIMLLTSLGAVYEAATFSPVILGTITFGIDLYTAVIIPLIFAGFVLSIVNNLSNEIKVERLANFINKAALWIQGGFLTIFIAILGIKGIAAQTMDEVTMKTAKFAVDKFIPIVGGALSDALSTVAGYSLLIKNAISWVGLLIVIGISLAPIIKILIMTISFKVTAALIEPISDKKIVSLISSAGDSLILLMSTIIVISIMVFIVIAMMASTGKTIITV